MDRIVIELPEGEKESFVKKCKESKATMSDVLRKFIRSYSDGKLNIETTDTIRVVE